MAMPKSHIVLWRIRYYHYYGDYSASHSNSQGLVQKCRCCRWWCIIVTGQYIIIISAANSSLVLWLLFTSRGRDFCSFLPSPSSSLLTQWPNDVNRHVHGYSRLFSKRTRTQKKGRKEGGKEGRQAEKEEEGENHRVISTLTGRQVPPCVSATIVFCFFSVFYPVQKIPHPQERPTNKLTPRQAIFFAKLQKVVHL